MTGPGLRVGPQALGWAAALLADRQETLERTFTVPASPLPLEYFHRDRRVKLNRGRGRGGPPG